MLYHKDIGFPADVKLPATKMLLDYSGHALVAAHDDQYGDIKLPEVLDTQAAKLIEIEVNDTGRVVKALYRLPHDDRYDLVMAVLMARRWVKTVWLNDRNDEHETLDRAKYAVPAA